jgi:electron transport complex protein RnfB
VNPELIDAIDALLPQTQCTQCGYRGCRPYAEAVARGEAEINQCPPGGAALIRKLGRLLDRPETPLNPAHGIEKPRAAALIDETRCIGCMLCIRACPVDAIVGTAKRMHTVLTEFCTGCELCLPPCPMDCIDMVELDGLAQQGNVHAGALARQSIESMATIARERIHFREFRVARDLHERGQRLEKKAREKGATLAAQPGGHDTDRKKAAIEAAIEAAIARARARRAGSKIT